MPRPRARRALFPAGDPFASVAGPTSLGELRRHVRHATWDVRPPRGLRERSVVLDYACDEDRARAGEGDDDRARRPPPALARGGRRGTASLQTPPAARTRGATHDGDEDKAPSRKPAGTTTATASAPRRERRSRDWPRSSATATGRPCACGLIQWEIAEHVGCSQMHISSCSRTGVCPQQDRPGGAGAPDAGQQLVDAARRSAPWPFPEAHVQHLAGVGARRGSSGSQAFWCTHSRRPAWRAGDLADEAVQRSQGWLRGHFSSTTGQIPNPTDVDRCLDLYHRSSAALERSRSCAFLGDRVIP
jgi:hypothetical protein